MILFIESVLLICMWIVKELLLNGSDWCWCLIFLIDVIVVLLNWLGLSFVVIVFGLVFGGYSVKLLIVYIWIRCDLGRK